MAVRSPARDPAFPARSMARYAVGEVNSTVTPKCATASASSGGVARSSSKVAAPARIGKTSRPPRPNVKPSGGVPVNTSVGWLCTRCFPKVSAMASTSRWKCMVALGTPVVPDVAASIATSSAAVTTSVKVPGLAAHELGQVVVAGSAVRHERKAGGGTGQFLGEPVVTDGHGGLGQLGQRAKLQAAQHGHGGHHHPPGLDHAKPGRDEPRVVGAPEQHALSGDQPEVLGQHVGHLVGPGQQFAIGPAVLGGEQARPVRPVCRDDLVEQRGGAVELLGILQFGQVEPERGPLLGRWQVVAAERVRMRGRRKLHGRAPQEEKPDRSSMLPN